MCFTAWLPRRGLPIYVFVSTVGQSSLRGCRVTKFLWNVANNMYMARTNRPNHLIKQMQQINVKPKRTKRKHCTEKKKKNETGNTCTRKTKTSTEKPKQFSKKLASAFKTQAFNPNRDLRTTPPASPNQKRRLFLFSATTAASRKERVRKDES